MKTNVSRRDVLRLAGGAAAGVMLSPPPWKLTDDLSPAELDEACRAVFLEP